MNAADVQRVDGRRLAPVPGTSYLARTRDAIFLVVNADSDAEVRRLLEWADASGRVQLGSRVDSLVARLAEVGRNGISVVAALHDETHLEVVLLGAVEVAVATTSGLRRLSGAGTEAWSSRVPAGAVIAAGGTAPDDPREGVPAGDLVTGLLMASGFVLTAEPSVFAGLAASALGAVAASGSPASAPAMVKAEPVMAVEPAMAKAEPAMAAEPVMAKAEPAMAADDHAGHDHAGHDHGAHDHGAHSPSVDVMDPGPTAILPSHQPPPPVEVAAPVVAAAAPAPVAAPPAPAAAPVVAAPPAAAAPVVAAPFIAPVVSPAPLPVAPVVPAVAPPAPPPVPAGPPPERPGVRVVALGGGAAPAPAPATPAQTPAHSAPASAAPSEPVVDVEGVHCARGHFNDPRARYCAVCGIGMVQGTVRLSRGERPPLGVLLLSTGRAVPLNGDLVLGREPDADPAVVNGSAIAVALAGNDALTVGRVHAEVRLRGWDVFLIDRSRNGTFVWDENTRAWRRIDPSAEHRLTPGERISFGPVGAVYETSHNQV